MSALAWLFGLGALAVAFPLIFHLIRQTPGGKTEFSSLMFLRPTPPRLARNTRLRNILLLLLRVAVLILIAFAFMRPFFRTKENEQSMMTSGRDIMILVDTSASMHRAGIGNEVQKSIERFLNQCEPGDQLAFATFDDQLRHLVGFPNGQIPIDNQITNIIAAVQTAAPTQATSDLAQALTAAADLLESRVVDRESKSKPQIVLITDQQQTPSLANLEGHAWPGAVKLKLIGVAPASSTNAAITGISFDPTQSDSVQVRFSNAIDSARENFSIQFGNDTDALPRSESSPVYLASGNTRSLPIDRPLQKNVQFVELFGDDDPFDNRFYFSVPPIDQMTILYLGDDDLADPNSPGYFLKAAFVESPTRQTRFITDPNDPLFKSGESLVVVATVPNATETPILDTHFLAGGKALFVLDSEAMAASVSQWTAANATTPQSKETPYSLLVDIDFTHPIFKIFGAPGLNDFTRIKFWQHAAVEFDATGTTRLIARFDDRSPAIWESTVAAGKAVVIAASWHPDSSQLATSPKFPIMMNELLDWSADRREPPKAYTVNQPIPIVGNPTDMTVIPPDRTPRQLASDEDAFADTGTPGIYQLIDSSDNSEISIAVNIDPLESRSETYTSEQLEAFGVTIGLQNSASQEQETLHRQADIEIESRQKVWKWLVIAAICFLFAETFLATYTRPHRQSGSTPVIES